MTDAVPHYFEIGQVYLTTQQTHIHTRCRATRLTLPKKTLGLCLSKEMYHYIQVAVLLLSDGQEVMVVDDMYEAPIWIELSKS